MLFGSHASEPSRGVTGPGRGGELLGLKTKCLSLGTTVLDGRNGGVSALVSQKPGWLEALSTTSLGATGLRYTPSHRTVDSQFPESSTKLCLEVTQAALITTGTIY